METSAISNHGHPSVGTAPAPATTDRLPNEMLVRCLRYLHPAEFAEVAQVNQRFEELSYETISSCAGISCDAVYECSLAARRVWMRKFAPRRALCQSPHLQELHIWHGIDAILRNPRLSNAKVSTAIVREMRQLPQGDYAVRAERFCKLGFLAEQSLFSLYQEGMALEGKVLDLTTGDVTQGALQQLVQSGAGPFDYTVCYNIQGEKVVYASRRARDLFLGAPIGSGGLLHQVMVEGFLPDESSLVERVFDTARLLQAFLRQLSVPIPTVLPQTQDTAMLISHSHFVQYSVDGIALVGIGGGVLGALMGALTTTWLLITDEEKGQCWEILRPILATVPEAWKGWAMATSIAVVSGFPQEIDSGVAIGLDWMDAIATEEAAPRLEPLRLSCLMSLFNLGIAHGALRATVQNIVERTPEGALKNQMIHYLVEHPVDE